MRYGIGTAGADGVFWWAIVNGEYYTQMNFHAFPFDQQQLQVGLVVHQGGAGFPGDGVELWPSSSGQYWTNAPKIGGCFLFARIDRLYKCEICDVHWAVRIMHCSFCMLTQAQ